MNAVTKLTRDLIRLMSEINSKPMGIGQRIIVNLFFGFWMILLFPILAISVWFKSFFEEKYTEPKRIAQTLRLEHKKKDA